MKLSLKYSFLNTIREFTSVFWCGVFPLILATLFYLSFGGYLEGDEFSLVNTGLVIQNDDSSFMEVIESVDDEYLDISEYNIDQANEALSNGEINGYYIIDEEVTLKVSTESVSTSIQSSILSSYEKNAALIEDILENEPENLNSALASMSNVKTNINDVGLSGKIIGVNNQFFYALIAMACLYGNFLGTYAINNIQADLSPLGMRRSVTPTNKIQVILSEFITNVGIHFFNLIILIMYIKLLGVVLDGSIWLILLVCLVGAVNGVALGMLIGVSCKKSENFKVGISLVVSMSLSFLAGLMFAGMKGIVQVNAPIVNMINPAALISDSFYSMTVFDSMERLFIDLSILIAETAVMLLISFMIVRRQRYDSI
ncbi:MAG TPA: ABC transporter permease [Anaerovoracaceae bacterium]|nr:ABC transporter permease [Anaerovoracaceae bacterium]